MMPGMSSSNASPNCSPTVALEEAVAARVALVDDDPLFVAALGQNLADSRFDVVTFGNGPAALAYFDGGGTADLILLDWRMPELDGIDVLHRLRQRGNDVPVIFLTVLSDQIYEEAALAGGAIDFVEKSRSFSILLRRIQLILAGRKGAGETAPEDTEARSDNRLTLDGLDLDLEACRALWQGRRVDLTLTEFNIVKAMATRPNQDLSYRAIYDLVRGAGFVAGYGTVGYRSNVRQFIKRIRQKFRAVDGDFDNIENYPGFGYRWRRETD